MRADQEQDARHEERRVGSDGGGGRDVREGIEERGEEGGRVQGSGGDGVHDALVHVGHRHLRSCTCKQAAV